MLLELINDSTKERMLAEGIYVYSVSVPTKDFIYNNKLYTVHKVIPFAYDSPSKESPTHQIHCLENKSTKVGFADFVPNNPYKPAPILDGSVYNIEPAS